MAGSTNSISYLARGLAEKGHQVVVALKEESLLDQLLQDSKVIRVPMKFRGKLSLADARDIRDVVIKYNIQIINAQSTIDRYTTAWAKFLYGLPVKIYHTRRIPPKSIGGLQFTFYRWITDKIIVVSEELKQIFIRRGFPANHIHVIYNGIPKERFQLWSESRVKEIKDQLQVKKGELIIGCVSRLKEQQQLVQAVEELNDPSIRLVFAGMKENQFPKLTISDKLMRNTLNLGRVPIEDILNWYRVFDINVLPSAGEGFGLVLLEAMAMECPVIGTNSGGIKNVIDNGINGLLFDNGDVETLKNNILEIRNNEALRLSLIENGLKSVHENYTFERTLNNYESFFMNELKL